MARVQQYVAPARLKEHLITLFDAMVASGTELEYDSASGSYARFRPEAVDFRLRDLLWTRARDSPS
jgi:hypothetical protein